MGLIVFYSDHTSEDPKSVVIPTFSNAPAKISEIRL
jgi:hypothetical protein